MQYKSQSRNKRRTAKRKDYSKYPFMNLSLKDLKGEKWIYIPEFEGYYAVSNFGRIWAIPRPVYSTTGQAYYTKERIRKQVLAQYFNAYTEDYTDQLVVKLRYGRESHAFQVCRLVYELFIGKITDGLRVVHKDGNNCNNRPENLVLMNGTEIYARGLMTNRLPRTSHLVIRKPKPIWSESNAPRAVVKYALSGKKIAEYDSIAAAAKANKVDRSGIRNVILKRSKQLYRSVYRYKGDLYKGEFKDFSWTKGITQYTLEGKRVRRFDSVKDASKRTGIDSDFISKCARKKTRRAGGFVWRYDGEIYKGEYKDPIKNQPKPIIQYTPAGKKIATFQSVNQAALETGFSAGPLLDCAYKRAMLSHGFVWRFQDDPYTGEHRHYRRGKPVTQYSLKGKKIETYETITQAAEKTGLTEANIQKNVMGINKTAGGYIWQEATPKEIDALPMASIQKPTGKKDAGNPRRKGVPPTGKHNRPSRAKLVTQYDLAGRMIKSFQSTREAEQETGVPSSSISAVASSDRLKTAHGFIWQYGAKRRVKLKISHKAKQSKPVTKLSLDGKQLATYPSIAEAARVEKVSYKRISAAVNNRHSKSAVGCRWIMTIN